MHTHAPRFRSLSYMTGVPPTLILAVLALGCIALPSQAQVPTHQHYQQTESFDTPSASGAVAPRLQNVGKHTFTVTTKSEQAQLFMNQGLNLTYGFNHAEAGRAYAEAARLDPNLAMAHWGMALVLGPNINAPMPPEEEPKALEHIRKAQALKAKASQRERDYIDALTARYTGKADDRVAADQAYAGAMRALYEKYPDDLDAATLYAESVMDLRPWNYWTRDGQPYEQTQEIIAPLDKVLTRNPDHPGALHYWIHLWEASNTPEKAEAAADRLMPLAPGAGHLVHMPGHIFQRVGRYSDAVKANQLAIVADEDYITQCRAQGLYPLGYYPHNVHFLWFAATMAGESKLAIDAANKTAGAIPPQALKDLPLLQTFVLVPDLALVRFGKWDEILSAPAPRADTLYTRGVRHYARGMAFIRKKDLDAANKEIEAVRKIAADPKLIEAPTSMSLNLADSVLRVALEVLDGEMAAAKGDYDSAVVHLDKAVRYQDALIYTEPDDWHQPVRHNLGAVLLQASRPVEAESVYWDDLRSHPKNGWSLFGLAQALRAQGKEAQAKLVDADFKKAWANADVTLTASRF
jgi:tetratricopeptide (TPR) repeat protein